VPAPNGEKSDEGGKERRRFEKEQARRNRPRLGEERPAIDRPAEDIERHAFVFHREEQAGRSLAEAVGKNGQPCPGADPLSGGGIYAE
jgi:hypothetical protein